MVRVDWTHIAIDNVESIRAYLKRFNPEAAERIAGRIVSMGNSLASFPDRGRLATASCRELVVLRTYLLLYERQGDAVSILRVRHAAQDR